MCSKEKQRHAKSNDITKEYETKTIITLLMTFSAASLIVSTYPICEAYA